MQMAVKYHSFSLNVSDKRGNQLFRFGVSTEKQCYTGNRAVLMERWFLAVFFSYPVVGFCIPGNFYIAILNISTSIWKGKHIHLAIIILVSQHMSLCGWLSPVSESVTQFFLFGYMITEKLRCCVKSNREQSTVICKSQTLSRIYSQQNVENIKYLNREVVQNILF